MTSRVAIVDLDGTVYRGESLIPGADRGIAALRDAGYQVRFVSNNPTRAPARYAEKLRGMGIDADPDHVVSAGAVTATTLADRHDEQPVLLVGTEGLQSLLETAGVTVTDEPGPAEALLVSWDPTFGYDDLSTVLDLEHDIPFYGTDPDRTYPEEDGSLGPGSGAIIGSVEATLDRAPDEIFGKPSEVLFEQALAGTDADPADCLVVGDRLTTDIELGRRAGTRTVLVRTGVTDQRELDAADIEPDHVLEDLGSIEQVL